ncbi:MAG: cysteine synthase family protein [Chloroflexi bacterium]|nr:cysteine synthase family protein [Chloroflexota bacterium]MCI0574601.1 cysteine synthase family protein [Chloroflexota bacterium]MCI0644047.1 cysteine synthase family protein [Chloroflexota bacterium]MCI0731721.1 cysteine synthase family protein [Chloroflexota bacterium]
MLPTIEKTEKPLFSTPISRPTSLEAQVGNTPLLHLERTAAAAGLPETVHLYAKAEWFNPSGSVKDRPALNIIRTAEWQGLLRPGMTLLDSTSGNMGIAYAMFGAARGYRVKLALPGNASPERVAILRAYGAEVIFTDPMEGSDGAIREARRLAAEAPEGVYYANQYNNPANWQAHYFTTANEIWTQTGQAVTHFVAGLGTSGTFVGTTRRLKELNPFIQCVAMQPDSPFNGLEGLKHMPTAIKPGIYDEYLADANVTVKTEAAYDMAHQLARQEGLFVGISAAAAVIAAVEVARTLERGVVVTILPDNGLKYLSERFWKG